MKILFSIICFNLVSSICLALPLDQMFFRAAAMRQGVIKKSASFNPGEIYIEHGRDTDWHATYVTKINSVRGDVLNFTESRSFAGSVSSSRRDVTLNMATGKILSVVVDGRQVAENIDHIKPIIKTISSEVVETAFGSKKCQTLEAVVDGVELSPFKFLYCDSMPGSGILVQTRSFFGYGTELKDYLK